MSRLFPELDATEAWAEPVIGDELAPSADAPPERPLRKATVVFDKALGLPGRFKTATGECHVHSVELIGPDRLALNIEGGGVPPFTLYILPGRAPQTFATTPHLSLIVRGTDRSQAVELLVTQAAYRLHNAPFELLRDVAAADPEVARAASSGAPPTMPGVSFPPTDIDVEYLNSLGFGYSPPDAWRNFLQGHENNYGGIENSRGYCPRVSGDVVNVNHTEIECYYSSPPQHDGSVAFWNHAQPDIEARIASEGHHVELFSDLGETDVIKGGQVKLDRLFDQLAGEEHRPKVVVVTSTCTTTVIGDDIQGSIEKLKRKLPLHVVNMGQSRDIKQTIFDEARARPGFLDVPKKKGAINLLGLPKLLGHRELLELLAEAGVTINVWLLPEIDPRELPHYMAAELQVLYDWPFLDESYRGLVGDLPIPSLRPPSPFGIEGTKRFLAALGDALGDPHLFEEPLARRLERIQPEWDRLSREARGYRLGFVGEERTLLRFFKTRQVLGIPVLQLLEEMGFGIDFYLTRPKAKKPSDGVIERGRRRTRYFETRDELEELLRTAEAAAFYSEIHFDNRVTRSGKNSFSLADFGRIGLEGSLEALRRVLGACKLPFFRTYAEYLGRPFSVGHADVAEASTP